MLTMSIGIIVMGGGLLIFGLVPKDQAWIVFVGVAIFAFANPFHNAPMRSILRESIEPHMQGRVFALLTTAAKAAIPIGMIISGPLADTLDVQAWFIVTAVYCIFMGFTLLAIPATRNLEYGKKSAKTELIQTPQ